MNKKDLIIIGAGLSGLYLATLLKDSFNVIILEARERLGGRILTLDGHDMGPSWIWQHQSHILKLLSELNLELFSQYTSGDSLYDEPKGVQRFDNPPSAPSARVTGGLEQLIYALANKLPKDMLHLEQRVEKIIHSGEYLQVLTQEKHYTVEYVISTLPPRVAMHNIVYEPRISQDILEQLQKTPTWMGHTAKCIIEFEHAFWREEGLSGFCFSHLGPLGEIHDACTQEKAALFGFLHQKASTQNIEDEVKTQMHRLFGENSKLIKKIYFMDWREEIFSATLEDKEGLSTHPDYGLDLNAYDEKLIFSGTETSYDNGGYLEGAIISAKKVRNRLLSL